MDEILIEAPSGVRMNFKQVNKWEDESIEDMIIDGHLREPDESYTIKSEGFQVYPDLSPIHCGSSAGSYKDGLRVMF